MSEKYRNMNKNKIRVVADLLPLLVSRHVSTRPFQIRVCSLFIIRSYFKTSYLILLIINISIV